MIFQTFQKQFLLTDNFRRNRRKLSVNYLFEY